MEKNLDYIEKFKNSNSEDKGSGSNDSFEKAQQKIHDLVDLLKKNKEQFDESEFKASLSEYLENYHRILYSEISVIIFQYHTTDTSSECNNNNEKIVDNIIYNLSFIANKTSLDENMDECSKTIFKLLDHVLLANRQYNELATTEKNVKPIISTEIENFRKKIDEQKRDLVEIKKDYEGKLDGQKNELLTQMVSIVSIFVGIAFVMFGGMSLLNELFDFSGMRYIPVTEIICLGALMGIVIVAIIYVFMLFVLKLTDKDIKSKYSPNAIVLAVVAGLALILIFTFIIWIFKPTINAYGDETGYIQSEHKAYVTDSNVLEKYKN